MPKTSYERLLAVDEDDHNEIPIVLALQIRHFPEGGSLPVVSWRTRLWPNGPSRRFYNYKGEPWSLSAPRAFRLMTEFERKGGLAKEYLDDVRRPQFQTMVSTETPTARMNVFEEITAYSEDWGADPFWVVLQEPSLDVASAAGWRKVLIVDPHTGRATFRSTTMNTTYKPRAELRPGSDRYLDNSMQDTNVQQARELLRHLRSLIDTHEIPNWP